MRDEIQVFPRNAAYGNEVFMHSIIDKCITIREDAIVKDALKQIDANSEGLLFVVDESGRLIGALTDGDVRRALISGKALNDSIKNIYNPKPFSVTKAEYDENAIKNIMLQERYEVIPVVDESNILDAYVTWDDILAGEDHPKSWKEINVPVVIMAGGKGTRMAPFTNVLPKPLIPIGDKTILELIIQEFAKHKISSFFFTVNYRGDMIRAYFEGIEKDYEVKYLKEDDFYGTAGSLKLLPNNIKGPFVVSNCDIIVKVDFSDVLRFHTESGAMLTVLSSIQHHRIPYGVISYKNGGIVVGIEEKPEYSFCVNTGVYIVDAECIKLIPKNEVFHMTDLISLLMKNDQKVVTYPVNENEYIDIGQWDEYRQAVALLS